MFNNSGNFRGSDQLSCRPVGSPEPIPEEHKAPGHGEASVCTGGSLLRSQGSYVLDPMSMFMARLTGQQQNKTQENRCAIQVYPTSVFVIYCIHYETIKLLCI